MHIFRVNNVKINIIFIQEQHCSDFGSFEMHHLRKYALSQSPNLDPSYISMASSTHGGFLERGKRRAVLFLPTVSHFPGSSRQAESGNKLPDWAHSILSSASHLLGKFVNAFWICPTLCISVTFYFVCTIQYCMCLISLILYKLGQPE